MSQDIENLMHALARELELDALAFDEDDMCMLQGENGMSLALLRQDSGHALTLAASIYPLQDATRAALCEKLMKMNFLLLETQGSTLSIDEEGQEVVVCRQMTLPGLEPEAFVDQVLDFLLLSSRLREQLLALQLPGTGPSIRDSSTWISG